METVEDAGGKKPVSFLRMKCRAHKFQIIFRNDRQLPGEYVNIEHIFDRSH